MYFGAPGKGLRRRVRGILEAQGGTDAPRVSVLIPVFNQEAFVAEAIRSAQDQSFPDIEILVHDDGSTDRTVEIVKALARDDARIRLTASDRNQGVAHARNRLIEEARGAYICWIDADDMMAAGKVAAQCAFLDANPGVDAVATGLRPIDGRGAALEAGGLRRPRGAGQRIFIPPFATVTIMYRREALARAFPLRPFKDGSDFDLVLRVARRGEIAFMADALYIRRYHEGQMSRRAGSGHMIAVASNLYRTFGLEDLVDGTAIDEPVLLRRILRDRPQLFLTLQKTAGAGSLGMTEGRFALVLVLLHSVRRIGTVGERLTVVAGCLRHAPGALCQVVGFWLRRRRAARSLYA